jgi:KaiC/GvpD/RAD55 family RecA-like ATPase
LRDNARMALEFDLVLVVVDPINSVCRNSDSEFASDSKARALILRELDPIKRAGCNVLIVQEDRGTPGDAERDFEKYIADTVIHTTIEQVRDYSQRYLEITKSRFQREQRGKHAFSIVPGVGLRVFPSSASVNARVRRRDLTVPAIEVSSGLQAVDRIIGPHGLSRGDVLVYEGSRDCPLHDVGTMFLGGTTDRSAGIALYVSIGRSKARVQAIVKLVSSRNRAHWRRSNPIQIVSLPVGHVNPGLVLQVIERAFDNSRAEGNLIERVLVDNVSDWTTNCPLIAQDEVFAPTLLDLIRKRGATSAFLCSGTSERLERSIVDGADCHIQLQPFDYRGSQRSAMRVRRTRHMEHQRGVFELLLAENGLTTKPLLLQFGEHGRPLPIKVRLFLHSESSAHRIYNRAILASVKAVVSPDAAIDPTEALVWSRALSRYDTSAVDELRIAQIDEFQLGDAEDSKGSGIGRLHSFPPTDAGYGDERDSLLDDAVRCSGNDLVMALPYLDNLSLFAHRRGEFDENAQLDWHDIASQADGAGDAPYFDFPRKSPENFNCLFLEILLSLAAKSNDVAPAGERDWLLRMLSLEHALEAAALLRQLCRPAMRLARRNPPATAECILGNPPHQRHESDAFVRRPGVITVDSRARAWRHWFTTLREMTSTMAAKDSEDIIVRPLPGNVAISGRWYIGIPSNSAAPDDGVRILASLLNRESELERLWHGVGLPVRPSFYAEVTPEDDTIPFGPGARYVGPPIRGLLEGAWRRSRIPGYARVASALSAHLKRLIEIGDSTDVRSATARVLASARRAIEYLVDADS